MDGIVDTSTGWKIQGLEEGLEEVSLNDRAVKKEGMGFVSSEGGSLL